MNVLGLSQLQVDGEKRRYMLVCLGRGNHRRSMQGRESDDSELVSKVPGDLCSSFQGTCTQL